MNWDAIGAVGEILGALAVFFTLMYLARQVSLTREQFKQQAEDEIQTKVFAAHDPMYQGQMMDVFYKGQYEPDELTDAERYAFRMLMGRHVAVMNQIVQRVEDGTLKPEIASQLAEFYDQTYFQSPGGQLWAETNPVVHEILERMRARH